MSEKGRKVDELVPLDQVNSVSEVVRINLPLGGRVDASQLGVRVKDIEDICRFAGIGALNIVGTNERIAPTVSGVDRNGGAIGAFDLVDEDAEKVDIGKDLYLFKPAKWVEANLKINTIDLQGGGNPEELARILDQELARLLRFASKEFLGRLDKEDVKMDLVSAGFASFLTLVISLLRFRGGAPLDIHIFLPMMLIASRVGEIFTHSSFAKNFGRKFRLSPLSLAGCEWDRYLLVDVKEVYRKLFGQRLIEVIKE